MKTCIFQGCEKKQHARGLCSSHRRQANAGKPLTPLKDMGNGKSVDQRFWSKVEKTNTCWNWIGALDSRGYGAFRVGRHVGAHRVSYELENGKIPNGFSLDHICHNRRCVNPAHLRPVTQKQNQEHRAGPNKNSATGIHGVISSRNGKRYRGQVMHNRERYIAGYFDTEEEARVAVVELRNSLFTHNTRDRLSQ